MSRTKKSLYNIISSMTYELVAMICALILPRFLLSAYGSAYNGMTASITQFLSYISVLTLGISGSTRVAIYKANAGSDPFAVSRILKATETYMRKVAYAFIAYMFVLMMVYPFIVKDEFRWIETASLIAIIGIGTFAEYFFGITYRTLLMATQRQYILNCIQIGSKIVNTILSVVLIILGANIQVVKLGSSICFASTPILLNWAVKKMYRIQTNVEPDNTALKQRGAVMAHSIANTVHEYTPVFLLTVFTSPSIISVYSIYELVFSSLRKLQHVFTSGLESAFGDLWAQNQIAKFTERFRTLEYLMYSFVIVAYTCAGNLVLSFIQLYVKNINDVNYVLPSYAFLATLSSALFCLRTPYLTAVQAAGKYQETRNGAFYEAGINFTISIYGVLVWGINGVVAGTLVANAFRTIQYMVFLNRNMLKISISHLIMRISWLGVNVFISALVQYKLIALLGCQTWESWLIGAIVCVVIAALIVLVTSALFYRRDLHFVFQLVYDMLK